MPLSLQGVELLLRVKKHILQKPSRLRMSQYFVSAERHPSFVVTEKGKKKFQLKGLYNEPDVCVVPDCGTVGCVAGWCIKLSGGDESIADAGEMARILNITLKEAYELALVNSWPSERRDAYFVAKTQRQRARLVAQEIDFFIKAHMPVNAAQSTT